MTIFLVAMKKYQMMDFQIRMSMETRIAKFLYNLDFKVLLSYLLLCFSYYLNFLINNNMLLYKVLNLYSTYKNYFLLIY